MNCKNCNTRVNQNYCQHCGHPTNLKRIDGQYIVHEVQHILNFEKGILYTIRELITEPGQSVKQFLNDNRKKLVKPVLFIIVTSLIYSIVNSFFHFEEGYINYVNTNESTTILIFKWVQEHYGYANIMMGFFIAFWIKLFFRKHPFNFFEILILLCFVMGIGMLIYSVFGIIEGLTNFKLMQVGGIMGFVYSTWAIGQFFDGRKGVSYVKSFFAYVLGILTFTLSTVIIGTIIDNVVT